MAGTDQQDDLWKLKSFALPGDVVEDVRRKFGTKRGQHRRSCVVFVAGFRLRTAFCALAIDELLYEINSGFRRWVRKRRGNVHRIGVERPLGLGQPLPRPILIRADSEVLIERDLLHLGSR